MPGPERDASRERLLRKHDLGAEHEAAVTIAVDASERVGHRIRSVGTPVAEVEDQLVDRKGEAGVPVPVLAEAIPSLVVVVGAGLVADDAVDRRREHADLVERVAGLAFEGPYAPGLGEIVRRPVDVAAERKL